jgi:hypothetical protein
MAEDSQLIPIKKIPELDMGREKSEESSVNRLDRAENSQLIPGIKARARQGREYCSQLIPGIKARARQGRE